MLTLPDAGDWLCDRYELTAVIKHGGMGTVFRARDHASESDCALKVMKPHLFGSEQMQLRFRREALEAGAIDSPFVVKIFNTEISESGLPFLVMELLAGRDLDAIMLAGEPRDPAVALSYVTQISAGLEATHKAGIVHRDLKPENIFVLASGERLKLLDFGIAKFLDKATVTTGILGTPLYISPEQIHGEIRIGPLADVYALGMLGYLLLAGEAYWAPERDALDLYKFLMRHLKGPEASACERALERSGVLLPAAFDDWFARATATTPTDRFASPTELAHALAEALGLR